MQKQILTKFNFIKSATLHAKDVGGVPHVFMELNPEFPEDEFSKIQDNSKYPSLVIGMSRLYQNLEKKRKYADLYFKDEEEAKRFVMDFTKNNPDPKNILCVEKKGHPKIHKESKVQIPSM